MAMMAPLALASIIGSGASAVASIAQARKAGKGVTMAPPPQPEKEPQYDVFKRRNARGPAAYGIPTPEALGSAPTASTKIGQ